MKHKLFILFFSIMIALYIASYSLSILEKEKYQVEDTSFFSNLLATNEDDRGWKG